VLGQRNWGLVCESLRSVDEANAAGEDIALDVYPYTAGSTTLITLLPPEELSAGEPELRRRLANPTFRAEVAERVRTTAQFRLDEVQLAAVPSRPDASGRRVIDVAEQDGIDPAELVLRLIELDGSSVVMLGFGMDEVDVRRVIRHPRAMIGSDGWILSTAGSGHAHPRNFACAPRVLAHYVRDEAMLDIETAVAKLAGLPAARLGLTDRGIVQPGMAADIVVLDLERLEEGATYARPAAYPVGVEYVVVNGTLAVAGGEPTGDRPGQVLRSSGNAERATRRRTTQGER
jgi:N-acyl-D-amino-acid deacylase